jgi:hypothetical protein
LSPPIRSPVPSNASEYPIRAQITPAIAMALTLIMNVLRAFFARTSPA